jgi:hypothetical protein
MTIFSLIFTVNLAIWVRSWGEQVQKAGNFGALADEPA